MEGGEGGKKFVSLQLSSFLYPSYGPSAPPLKKQSKIAKVKRSAVMFERNADRKWINRVSLVSDFPHARSAVTSD